MASSMLGSRTLRATAVARPPRGCRVRPVRVSTCRRRAGTVAVQAFFSFLQPKPAAPASDPRRDELSEELISVCEATAGGARASPASKEQIEQLVEELAPLGVKNPVRSPLLWGTYELLYSSEPGAIGGPLAKGPVKSVKQKLVEPNGLVDEVTFSSLGFLKGSSKLFGALKPINADTFELTIGRGEVNTGLGGSKQEELDIEVRMQITYLDDNLRVTRFLDDEGEILFIFKRIDDDDEVAAAEEEEEEEARPAPRLSLPLFGGSAKTESLATRAERQVRAQQTRAERAEKQAPPSPAPAPRRPGTGFFFVGGKAAEKEEEDEEEETPAQRRAREREEAAAARRLEAEERARAQEEARAAARAAAEKAKAEAGREAARKRAEQEREEARRRAEQEREEQRARAAAIREQLAELGEELKEVQAAAREAAKELQDVKREYAPALKQVSAAEAAIASAAKQAQDVTAALQQAAEERKAAEAALKEAQAFAKEAEAAYKKMQEALSVKA